MAHLPHMACNGGIMDMNIQVVWTMHGLSMEKHQPSYQVIQLAWWEWLYELFVS